MDWQESGPHEWDFGSYGHCEVWLTLRTFEINFFFLVLHALLSVFYYYALSDVMHGRPASNLEFKALGMMSCRGSAKRNYYLLYCSKHNLGSFHFSAYLSQGLQNHDDATSCYLTFESLIIFYLYQLFGVVLWSNLSDCTLRYEWVVEICIDMRAGGDIAYLFCYYIYFNSLWWQSGQK